MPNLYNKITAEIDPIIIEAIERSIITIKGDKVTYNINKKKSYNWNDPEEWVRARTIAFLTIVKGYNPLKILTEVKVPRRTPSDLADIVLYEDDSCKRPYLVIENKQSGVNDREKKQAIEQAFGNANSLRAKITMYYDYNNAILYDVLNYDSMERELNKIGGLTEVPENYGEIPEYKYFAGTENDIKETKASILESKLRRAHSIIWSGGKRDPLTSFDEWSKILFAKVRDERSTPNGNKRRFQIGTNESITVVANRVHSLFKEACERDKSIFNSNTRINLNDKKIYDIVELIQEISFVSTDVDNIGRAFENFFGSVFRGELGQYFTMRPIARFTVAFLNIDETDFVIDPTCGSGGFLLEVLLQVWHKLEKLYSGQPEMERIRVDFALNNVYGIEIHEILARICKINLLLHHDGHTNIEGDRSCLENTFALRRLNPPVECFTKIVGNPPFGDSVEENDEDHLGENKLENFSLAKGKDKIASEQIIVERCIELLEAGGEFGLVIPDGLLNNQGEGSNCPKFRRFLVKNGFIKAIISLPDYAFRKSGAQNKTSILFFKKFTETERIQFNDLFNEYIESINSDDDESSEIITISDNVVEISVEDEESAILYAYQHMNYSIFLAEPNFIGYNSIGNIIDKNDLYNSDENLNINENQDGSILGEYNKFINNPDAYSGAFKPDCMGIKFTELWISHNSRRLDPKYYLYKRIESHNMDEGWIRVKLGDILERREEEITPQFYPDKEFTVMSIFQTGEIGKRQAGKGKNPPEWLGMYFEESSSKWYRANKNDVVYSSIDLWRGCVAIVPEEFDGAIVTKEFPIYKLKSQIIEAELLSCILRSSSYKRAFRAITTGHSNRRRTQTADFESIEISFPADKEKQKELIAELQKTKKELKRYHNQLKEKENEFNLKIMGSEEYAYEEPINDSEYLEENDNID